MNLSLIIKNSNITTYNAESFNYYSNLIIIIFGFITNLICIIIFINIIKRSTTDIRMFNYLFMKSICDFLLFALAIIHPLNNCSHSRLCSIYFFKLYDDLYLHWIDPSLTIASVYFEVLATIVCYLSLKNRFSFLFKKKSFYLNSFIILFISFLLNFPKVYYHQISQTLLLRFVSYSFSTLRDIISTIILIYVNILIFIEIKKLIMFKIEHKNQKTLLVSILAKKRKTKMIIVLAINCIIFHAPIVLWQFYGQFNIKNKYWEIYLNFAINTLWFSYATPFFIYIIFNNIFRSTFFEFITNLITILKF